MRDASRSPRALACASVALAVAGCTAVTTTAQPRHEPDGPATTYAAVVLRTSGPAPVAPDDECRIEVTPVRGPSFNCRVRITCDGEVLYGQPNAGYNECRRERERFVYARDDYGTRADGDPRMTFDLRRGHVVVTDRDPEVDMVLGIDRSGPPAGTTPSVPPGYE